MTDKQIVNLLADWLDHLDGRDILDSYQRDLDDFMADMKKALKQRKGSE